MSPASLVPFTLDQLLAEPALVAELPREVVTPLLADLRRLETYLEDRQQTVDSGNGARRDSDTPPRDQYNLTVEEVADQTGMSRDWVYRNADRLPFARKVGSRWRFSKQGLDQWFRQRQGR